MQYRAAAAGSVPRSGGGRERKGLSALRRPSRVKTPISMTPKTGSWTNWRSTLKRNTAGTVQGF